MIRFIFIFLCFTLIACGFVWLVNNPGNVQFQWLGYQVDTSVAFLLTALLIILIALSVLYWLVHTLLAIPGWIERRRTLKHYQRGLQAVTRSITSLALADKSNARQAVRDARKQLGNTPLVMVLQAQLARMSGDWQEAQQQLEAMLDHPESALLAARGLGEHYLEKGEVHRALPYARRALELAPRDEISIRRMVGIYITQGEYKHALDILEARNSKRALESSTRKHWKAIVCVEQAKALMAEKLVERATLCTKQAIALWPEHPAIAAYHSALLIEAEEGDAAQAAIRSGWKHTPHPILATLFLSVIKPLPPEQQLKRVSWLISKHSAHLESYLLKAKIALQAKEWHVARKMLQEAIALEEVPRACALMAELENKEFGDTAEVNAWHSRAQKAEPDYSWVCAECNHGDEIWHSHCPQCMAFDSLAWKRVHYPLVQV